MIIGLGTDIVEIPRIAKAIKKFGHKFAARILSIAEYQCWQQEKYPERYLAKRFAAKEATFKALGSTGIAISKLIFRDIELTKLHYGAPKILLHNYAKKLQDNLGVTKINISISDEVSYAVATVILEAL